ncbi:hypothetical protein HZA73_00630 [candidate division TA06 bacterium]|nr:hypothetical protein [candidate division TA06 bacterium]
MRKTPKSTADFAGLAENLIKGGEGNKAEIARWGLTPPALRKLLDLYNDADSRQEKAKAELHLATAGWLEAKKKLSGEIARWVSVLEGNYGKTGDKLQEFGIAPRMYKPRKGPRAKKA